MSFIQSIILDMPVLPAKGNQYSLMVTETENTLGFIPEWEVVDGVIVCESENWKGAEEIIQALGGTAEIENQKISITAEPGEITLELEQYKETREPDSVVVVPKTYVLYEYPH